MGVYRVVSNLRILFAFPKDTHQVVDNCLYLASRDQMPSYALTDICTYMTYNHNHTDKHTHIHMNKNESKY